MLRASLYALLAFVHAFVSECVCFVYVHAFGVFGMLYVRACGRTHAWLSRVMSVVGYVRAGCGVGVKCARACIPCVSVAIF